MRVHDGSILRPKRTILERHGMLLVMSGNWISSAADGMVVVGTSVGPRIIRRLVVLGMIVREFGFVEFLEEGGTRRMVVKVGRMIVVRPGRIYGDCMVIMGVSKNITDRGVKMLVDGIMYFVARRGSTWGR